MFKLLAVWLSGCAYIVCWLVVFLFCFFFCFFFCCSFFLLFFFVWFSLSKYYRWEFALYTIYQWVVQRSVGIVLLVYTHYLCHSLLHPLLCRGQVGGSHFKIPNSFTFLFLLSKNCKHASHEHIFVVAWIPYQCSFPFHKSGWNL